MIDVEEQEDSAPICPHCSAEISRIWARRLRSLFGRRYIYFCARCRKVLGISQRKGFWMG